MMTSPIRQAVLNSVLQSMVVYTTARLHHKDRQCRLFERENGPFMLRADGGFQRGDGSF